MGIDEDVMGGPNSAGPADARCGMSNSESLPTVSLGTTSSSRSGREAGLWLASPTTAWVESIALEPTEYRIDDERGLEGGVMNGSREDVNGATVPANK